MLEITNIDKKDCTITVYFQYDSEWEIFLSQNKIVNKYNENIESVPDSIAIIPALCNLLPVAWVFNLKIRCPEIDKTFRNALPRIVAGYNEMYPDIDFRGELSANKTVLNKYATGSSAVLFSGGVDATTTAYRHMDEKPDVITVFGSDIQLSDKDGIRNVNNLNADFAKKHGLRYEKIYSTFRSFMDDSRMHEAIRKINQNYDWWHEFQHGIGLIGLVSPIAYIRGYSKVYIASSYHCSQRGCYTCASDPTIDNELKYGSTITIHDGYELTRQDKIKYICEYAKRKNQKPFLRVCWESSGGKNCCHCEKCRRTYLAILAEKSNPGDFGLDFTDKQYRRMVHWYKRHLPYNFNKTVLPLYGAIRDTFMENYLKEEAPCGLEWIWEVKIGAKPFSPTKRLIDKVRRKIGIE